MNRASACGPSVTLRPSTVTTRPRSSITVSPQQESPGVGAGQLVRDQPDQRAEPVPFRNDRGDAGLAQRSGGHRPDGRGRHPTGESADEVGKYPHAGGRLQGRLGRRCAGEGHRVQLVQAGGVDQLGQPVLRGGVDPPVRRDGQHARTRLPEAGRAGPRRCSRGAGSPPGDRSGRPRSRHPRATPWCRGWSAGRRAVRRPAPHRGPSGRGRRSGRSPMRRSVPHPVRRRRPPPTIGASRSRWSPAPPRDAP